MTERKPTLYSLLDVGEPTPFGPHPRGRTRAMLLLAAATQASACTMGTESVPDTGTWDTGLSADIGAPEIDQAITDGLGPDEAGFDHGLDDTDAGVDSGTDGG